ncbi:porin family protein [Roseivirga pacifica]
MKRKRRTQRLFLLLLIITFNTLNAQDFYLGLKTGVGVSDFQYDGSSAENLSPKIMPNVALTYNYRFPESIFGMNIETGYSNRGANIDSENLDYRLNFVDLPVMLDIYPVAFVRLNVGGEMSYLASAKNRLDDGSKEDVTRNFDQRTVFSALAGINLSMTYFMDLGVRYNYPITNVSQNDPLLGIENTKVHYVQAYMMLKIAN